MDCAQRVDTTIEDKKWTPELVQENRELRLGWILKAASAYSPGNPREARDKELKRRSCGCGGRKGAGSTGA